MDVSKNLIESVRKCLRINHDEFDGEIIALIQAARADLELAGVLREKTQDESDPLIIRAVTCFVKAEFGLDNQDAEKYRESYQMQRRQLALASAYIKKE